VSEITAIHCVVPFEVAGDMCQPKSTAEDDAIKGKWVRVKRNLNLELGYWFGSLVSIYLYRNIII
jgi:hypothetical protein